MPNQSRGAEKQNPQPVAAFCQVEGLSEEGGILRWQKFP
jgi:hypothetical protein